LKTGVMMGGQWLKKLAPEHSKRRDALRRTRRTVERFLPSVGRLFAARRSVPAGPAFDAYDLPNVNLFEEQLAVFKESLMAAPPSEAQRKDLDFLMTVGEIFALVVYAALALENARIYALEDDVVDQIFDVLVRDLARFAVELHGKTSTTPEQMAYCLKMIRKPVVDEARYGRVWERQVYALAGAYEMNP